MLDVIPDSRIVEQTHEKLRKRERDNRNNVISRLARHNACIVSGVLEERGLPSVSITQAEFCERIRAKRAGIPAMKTFSSAGTTSCRASGRTC